MKIKKIKDIIIGSKIKISKSKNKTIEGLEGKVIDQTKNTITLETKQGIKKIVLSQVEMKNEK